jgi:hypothetical protein
LRLDVLAEQRIGADPAIVAVELPADLRLGESFVGSVRMVSDRREQRDWVVYRDDQAIAKGSVALAPGEETVVSFADRPTGSGLVRYRVELDRRNDARPGNNSARASLRLSGGERVLVISGDGQPGNVSHALQAAGIQVRNRREGQLSLADLAGMQAVVLDNVPDGVLGSVGAQALADWTEHLGGGLVVLGGRRAFGGGGYHLSPLEKVLPVSSELRDEHRQLAMALAITMDRSGSMSADIGDGRTKMDLANEGAIAAIQLLGPRDKVSVHVVDTEVHPVIHMTDAVHREALIRQVRGLQSQGGGIYVGKALMAAGKEVAITNRGTRHIVLFSDAADTEEPGDYQALLKRFSRVGITVSVIALGHQSDTDAQLLKDIARLGHGRIVFSRDAKEIPRLFANETALISHSTWVGEAVALQPKPGLTEALGGLQEVTNWPQVAGYNLTYLKPRATLLANAPGDPQAPAIASWRIGAGRAVAMGLAVDDPRDAALRNWSSFSTLLAGLVRWSSRPSDDDFGQLTAIRQNQAVRLRLQLDPAQRAQWPTAPQVQLLRDLPSNDQLTVETITLKPLSAGIWEGETVLRSAELVLPSVRLAKGANDIVLDGPALELPYSPEDQPHDQQQGAATLELLARLGGGHMRSELGDMFDGPASEGQRRSLALDVALAGAALLLLELTLRRMNWQLRLLPKGLLKRRAKVKRESPPKTLSPPTATPSKVPATSVKPPSPSPSPKKQAAASPAPESLTPSGGLGDALRKMKKRSDKS